MITVFGSINLDIVIPVPSLPGPGETVLGENYLIAPGGKGANQALAAARDGARVAMVGAVGRDYFATLTLVDLEGAGVDVSATARVNVTTGCAVISLAATGENQISVASGANRLVTAAQVPDAFLGPSTTLLMQRELSTTETETLIHRARALGTRIILNMAPALPIDEAALAMVDMLVANEREAATLAEWLGVPVAGLSARLGLTVLETRGASGAIWRDPDGGGWMIDALRIAPVDTTGAGDAFVGVLAAGLDGGLSPALALRRATVAAGIACTRTGAQASLATKEEIDARLHEVAEARPL